MSIEKRLSDLETAVTTMFPEALPLPAATRRLYSAVFGLDDGDAFHVEVLAAELSRGECVSLLPEGPGSVADRAAAVAESVFEQLEAAETGEAWMQAVMGCKPVAAALLRATEELFGSDGSKPAGNAPKLPGAEELR